MKGFPAVRLRRLRSRAGIRGMLDTPIPGLRRFLWPVFVLPGRNRKKHIASMPGQSRMTPDVLARTLGPLVGQGLGGVLLFGVADDSRKDPSGRVGQDGRGPVQTAAKMLKREFPDLVVATDVCLCAYTNHGHCGILAPDGQVDNDRTLQRLSAIAASHAEAGADIVAPSAMMDGQVASVRAALDRRGFSETLIMSYSTKFASSLYGPFRDAERSAPKHGDRRGHQASFANRRAAIRESEFDDAEGADILMVKPALFYLDVLAEIRRRTDLPVAAYNVSGEYAMIQAAADRGWGDLGAMAEEALCALDRAGADIIISYWANRYAEITRR